MIQIVFFNEDFQLCGKAKIEYKNLSWYREYYESGKFAIELHSKYLFSDAKYVYAKNRLEIGVIESIQIVEDGQNENILLSGFFAENLLNDKIIYPTYYGNGEMNASIHDCFNTYKDDLPIVADTAIASTDITTWQSTGDEIGQKFYELLKPLQKSYKVFFNPQTQMLEFSTYQGVDRSQTVVFGKKRKNITYLQANLDNSNYKNYFVIGGSGEGSDRIVETLDLSGGTYQKELFINASNIVYDSDEMTLSEYKEMLLQYGLEKSENYLKVEDIAVTPNSIYIYLEDYDLGDKVTVHVAELNINFEVRIVSIKEVVKNGVHTVTLTFGEKKVTTLKKARIRN